MRDSEEKVLELFESLSYHDELTTALESLRAECEDVARALAMAVLICSGLVSG